MRKPQIQPSLRSLSEADREQLANWLRHGEYDDVLERVNKPRPEGLGLAISIKPLQTFYAKVALLDAINFHLPPEKKLTLAVFETLAHGDILSLASANAATITEIHDTILGAVHHLAQSPDNTPTQLLNLQRLADFPARAALREQMAEMQAERLQLQREKEKRAQEMHAHKIAMDLRRESRAARREERCLQMDSQKLKRADEQNARAAQRLELTVKRFRLSLKSLAFRRKQHRDRMALRPSSPSPLQGERVGVRGSSVRGDSRQPQSDHLGPFASDLEGIRERARKHFGITPEESARRAALRKAWRTQQLENPSPEGTLDNSPATSVPGNLAAFNSVPEGRLNSTEVQPASHDLKNESNQ